MSDLKRDAIKYIRDRAKSKYNKDTKCYICGASDNLEFHHFSGMVNLLEKYLKENSIEITCEEDILSLRDEFIAVHNKELFHDTVTLCEKHHDHLHKVYGKSPALITASKQARWVEIQKEKYESKVVVA